jgi:hypothetical protein
MVLTSLALAFTVDVKTTDEAGIRMVLPDKVGDWTGQELRFCQNPSCMREWGVGDLKDRNICPSCSSEVGSMNLYEKQLLPPDTEILKKIYKNPDGQRIFVAIVMSGKERASIHRPQVCLVGQGNKILTSKVLPVDIAGRKTLDIMVLDLSRQMTSAAGGTAEASTYYAYWFVGKGRETPYHIQRMVWMATDRIFHNVSHRWAYISVMGMRQQNSDEYRQQLQAFVRDLYPEMAIN